MGIVRHSTRNLRSRARLPWQVTSEDVRRSVQQHKSLSDEASQRVLSSFEGLDRFAAASDVKSRVSKKSLDAQAEADYHSRRARQLQRQQTGQTGARSPVGSAHASQHAADFDARIRTASERVAATTSPTGLRSTNYDEFVKGTRRVPSRTAMSMSIHRYSDVARHAAHRAGAARIVGAPIADTVHGVDPFEESPIRAAVDHSSAASADPRRGAFAPANGPSAVLREEIDKRLAGVGTPQVTVPVAVPPLAACTPNPRVVDVIEDECAGRHEDPSKAAKRDKWQRWRAAQMRPDPFVRSLFGAPVQCVGTAIHFRDLPPSSIGASDPAETKAVAEVAGATLEPLLAADDAARDGPRGRRTRGDHAVSRKGLTRGSAVGAARGRGEAAQRAAANAHDAMHAEADDAVDDDLHHDDDDANDDDEAAAWTRVAFVDSDTDADAAYPSGARQVSSISHIDHSDGVSASASAFASIDTQVALSEAARAAAHRYSQRIERGRGERSNRAARKQSLLPEVILVGRANVGKSSLLNALVGRARQESGDVAGVTQAFTMFAVGVGLENPLLLKGGGNEMFEGGAGVVEGAARVGLGNGGDGGDGGGGAIGVDAGGRHVVYPHGDLTADTVREFAGRHGLRLTALGRHTHAGGDGGGAGARAVAGASGGNTAARSPAGETDSAPPSGLFGRYTANPSRAARALDGQIDERALYTGAWAPKDVAGGLTDAAVALAAAASRRASPSTSYAEMDVDAVTRGTSGSGAAGRVTAADVAAAQRVLAGTVPFPDGLFRVVDVPGYGFSWTSAAHTRSLHATLRSILEKRDNLCRVYVLVDAPTGLLQSDVEFIQYASQCQRSVKVVLTQCDLVPRDLLARRVEQTRQALCTIPHVTGVPLFVSAVTGQGVYRLQADIANRVKAVSSDYHNVATVAAAAAADSGCRVAALEAVAIRRFITASTVERKEVRKVLRDHKQRSVSLRGADGGDGERLVEVEPLRGGTKGGRGPGRSSTMEVYRYVATDDGVGGHGASASERMLREATAQLAQRTASMRGKLL